MDMGELLAVPLERERWRTFHVSLTTLNNKLDQQLCLALFEHCFATHLAIRARDLVPWQEFLAGSRASCAQSIPSIDRAAWTHLLNNKIGIKMLKELEINAPAHTQVHPPVLESEH